MPKSLLLNLLGGGRTWAVCCPNSFFQSISIKKKDRDHIYNGTNKLSSNFINKPTESLIQTLSVWVRLSKLLYVTRHIYMIIKNYRRDDSQTTRPLPFRQNSCCRAWRCASGGCRCAPAKSTQVSTDNWGPMSPLTVQSAHLHAVSLHSVTHHQPEKRRKSIVIIAIIMVR